MDLIERIEKPSKREQKIAFESYQSLVSAINHLKTDSPEIEIEETKEKIKLPLKALKLLVEIIKVTSQGKPISIMPVAMEMTTQQAAEVLGCSRPHLVSLLESGKIPFTKIGRHRRVKMDDVLNYRKDMKENQKKQLIQMMKFGEKEGLYDS